MIILKAISVLKLKPLEPIHARTATEATDTGSLLAASIDWVRFGCLKKKYGIWVRID